VQDFLKNSKNWTLLIRILRGIFSNGQKEFKGPNFSDGFTLMVINITILHSKSVSPTDGTITQDSTLNSNRAFQTAKTRKLKTLKITFKGR
jgi:hypothetical protein